MPFNLMMQQCNKIFELNVTIMSIYAEEEKTGRDYFDDDVDPLALIEGMENSDVNAFDVLSRHRRRRRAHAPQNKPDEGDDLEWAGFTSEEFTEEEGFFTEEEGDRGQMDDIFLDTGKRNKSQMSRGEQLDVSEFGITDNDIKNALSNEIDFGNMFENSFATRASAKGRKGRHSRRRGKHGGSRRRARDLPPEAAMKLGEANMMYAQQRNTEAISLLREVVRLAPYSPDAYTTLGLLYEEVGDHKRSLDFSMIAAHLTPKDVSLWRRLADLSMRCGYVRQTIYCLSQVIKRDRDDIDAKYERALLLAEIQDNRKALESLESVRSARPSDPEVVKHLARLYYRMSQHEKAVAVLREFISNYRSETDLTHINLLAELLSSPDLQEWEEVISVIDQTEKEFLGQGESLPLELLAKKGIAISHSINPDTGSKHLQTVLGQSVEIFPDIFLAIADDFESLGRHELAYPFLQALADEESVAGPLIWQKLADNRKVVEGPQSAANIWKNYIDQIAPDNPMYVNVVVRLADALRNSGDDKGAASALLLLDKCTSSISREDGKLEGTLQNSSGISLGDQLSLSTLMWNESASSIEQDVLYKAELLKSCGREDLMAELALPILNSTLISFASGISTDTKKVVMTAKSKAMTEGQSRDMGSAYVESNQVQDNSEAVFVGYVPYKRQRRKGSQQDADKKNSVESSLLAETDSKVTDMDVDVNDGDNLLEGQGTANEGQIEAIPGFDTGNRAGREPLLPGLLKDERPFQLLIDVSLGLIETGNIIQARGLTQNAIDVLGKRSPNRRKRDTMRLLHTCSFIGDRSKKDLYAAFNTFKGPATRWPLSPFLWNTFSKLLLTGNGPRQIIKFLQSLKYKAPESVPLSLTHGHVNMFSGNYGIALAEYFNAYRQAPDEPLVLFSIAVCLINIAVSRFAPNRNSNVLQAFAFLEEYSRVRKDSVESSYNFGRMCQHLSINYIAVDKYRMALKDARQSTSSISRPLDPSGSLLEDMHEEQTDRSDKRCTAWRSRGDPLSHASDEDMTLSREAAFNLALIYKESGAEDLARAVLREHLTF